MTDKKILKTLSVRRRAKTTTQFRMMAVAATIAAIFPENGDAG
jgi:hypothetical protein